MGNRRRAFAVVIGLSIVGVVALLTLRDKAGREAASDAKLPLIPRLEGAPEGAPTAPESHEAVDKRAEAALADWRNAILTRDADMVVKLDMAFMEAPGMFVEGLKTSAGSDGNERVRAFSTRQLGKFKRVDLAPTFQRLLDDKSAYVRKNAAWALGELSALDEGRAAARNVQAALRQLVRRDPAEDVRAAARTALERIEQTN